MNTRPLHVRSHSTGAFFCLLTFALLALSACDRVRKNIDAALPDNSGSEVTPTPVDPAKSQFSTGRLLVLNLQGGGVEDHLMQELLTALQGEEANQKAATHVAATHPDLTTGQMFITARRSSHASAIDIEANGPLGGYVNIYLDALMETFVESRRADQEVTTSPLETISEQMGELENELETAEAVVLEVSTRVSRISSESKLNANTAAIAQFQGALDKTTPEKAAEIAAKVSEMASESQVLKAGLAELDASEGKVNELQRRYDDLLTKMENLDLMGSRPPLSKVAVSIMERAKPKM